MMIRCIKNVCKILWKGEQPKSCSNNNVWLNQLVKEMAETIEDVKNDMRAGNVLIQRAFGKIDVLDDKIRVLKQKASNGLTVTQQDIDELGALSGGMKAALEALNTGVDAAEAEAQEETGGGEATGTTEGSGDATGAAGEVGADEDSGTKTE